MSGAWVIAGTVPEAGFPVTEGTAAANMDGRPIVRVGSHQVSVCRGTAALLTAACLSCRVLELDMPTAVLAGDAGSGKGSLSLYARLAEMAARRPAAGYAFHYILPHVPWHSRVLDALQKQTPAPVLVADAGFMYVAKMSGWAGAYDLFTPDAGEMAFLADENAPHPFYTRGFLLQDDLDVPALAERAHAAGNAARHMLVKGKIDYIVRNGVVIDSVDAPLVPCMEPVGGTGDTVAGIVTALLAGGYAMETACLLAARANRRMGQLAQPTPATQIAELLQHLPSALRSVLKDAG